MKLYFALTPEESKRKYIEYPEHPKYTHKAVHTSLTSLRNFIKLEFPDNHNQFNYIEFSSKEINIDSNVNSDEEHTVSVLLPIKITLKDKRINPLFKYIDKPAFYKW